MSFALTSCSYHVFLQSLQACCKVSSLSYQVVFFIEKSLNRAIVRLRQWWVCHPTMHVRVTLSAPCRCHWIHRSDRPHRQDSYLSRQGFLQDNVPDMP